MAHETNPLLVVQSYIDAFNKGDVEAMSACFAEKASILDGMPPHVWHGSSAGRDWYADVLTEGEHLGAGDYVVTLGQPLHDDITGDAAYIVVPASMEFNVRGQPFKQTGATFTVALRQVAGNWRIAAWAWAKGLAAT